MKSGEATIAFAVGIRPFDGLATQSVSGLDFRGGHLLALGIEQFLIFQLLDLSTGRTGTKTLFGERAWATMNWIAAISIFPNLPAAVTFLPHAIVIVQPLSLRATITLLRRIPLKFVPRDLLIRLGFPLRLGERIGLHRRQQLDAPVAAILQIDDRAIARIGQDCLHSTPNSRLRFIDHRGQGSCIRRLGFAAVRHDQMAARGNHALHGVERTEDFQLIASPPRAPRLRACSACAGFPAIPREPSATPRGNQCRFPARLTRIRPC